jgi:hypothetical protein
MRNFFVCHDIERVSSVVADYKLSLANMLLQNTNSTKELTTELTKQLTAWRRALRNSKFLNQVKLSLLCMETEVSLPHSQLPATCPNREYYKPCPFTAKGISNFFV